MKKNTQQNNCNKENKIFQLSLPLNLEVKIEANESVHTLIKITERLDYTALYKEYERLPRSGEATPKQMFQLVVLGFMQGIYSTRKLESACRNDIRFMYILAGKKVPDHNRFWSFIKHRFQGTAGENLFYQLVFYLEKEGEINFENLFVDGTKIEACANRYSFVWKKSTNRYETNLDEKISNLMISLTYRYPLLTQQASTNKEWLSALKNKASGVEFVYGRGRRKTQIQKEIEQLEGYILRKDKYTLYNHTFKGRNSFSKTDQDATFMRMKDDHMGNGQLKPGYNLQLGVEGEYVVGMDISSERSDHLTLLPFLERMHAGYGKSHKNLCADAGYESEENYKALEKMEINGFIKPQNYERSKKRKYKTNAFLRENMPYDPKSDTYTCPNGNIFSVAYKTKRKSVSGFESDVTVYECFGCNECPEKINCTKAKNNRKLSVSKDFVKHREEALIRITSEEGKIQRINRSIQSEGAFGVLKQDYGFRRFLRRGMTNVFTEMLLYIFAYNINKYHSKRLRMLFYIF